MAFDLHKLDENGVHSYEEILKCLTALYDPRIEEKILGFFCAMIIVVQLPFPYVALVTIKRALYVQCEVTRSIYRQFAPCGSFLPFNEWYRSLDIFMNFVEKKDKSYKAIISYLDVTNTCSDKSTVKIEWLTFSRGILNYNRTSIYVLNWSKMVVLIAKST